MSEVLVIGVDAATRLGKVGLALGSWRPDRPRVSLVRAVGGPQAAGLRDAPPEETALVLARVLSGWMASAPGPCLLAVDAPLGWPDGLRDGLAGHLAGAPLVPREGARPDLFLRATDRFVRQRLRLEPMSVAADRIARTAAAALDLLEHLRLERGAAVEVPVVPGPPAGVAAIEVYPRATLTGVRGGRRPEPYKEGGPEAEAARRRLLADLLGDPHGLDPGAVDLAPLEASDHVLDAAACVVAGADFLRGSVHPPPPADRARAAREGWIWFRGAPGSGEAGYPLGGG